MQKTTANRKNRARTSLPFWMATLFSTFILFITGSSNLGAGCIDLADEPLEIQSMGAPGMVMFMYDNSGSMEFTVMTPESEGSFHTPSENTYYGYCFLYDPDYGSGDLPTLQGSGDEMYWKSQWSGYNTIYYNPGIVYEPWPSWTAIEDVAVIPAAAPQADPDNPLTNVVKYTNTFSMNGTWKELEIGGGTNINDLINEVGIIVDNTDTRAVDPIVVDDEGDGVDVPGFTFTGDLWRWNRFSDDWLYYDGDYMNYYGDSNPLPVSATWTFDVATAGSYEVVASIPKYSNRTTKANYTITYGSGATTTKTISQYNRSGAIQAWVSLGTYNFLAGAGKGKVVLNFTTTSSGRSIGVDAIRLVPTFTTGSPVKYFESTGPWGISTSGDDYGINYLWTPQYNENYTANWTAKNLTKYADYDVYVRWVANSARSNAVQYTVDGTTVSMDQRSNSGKWMLLKQKANFGNTTTGSVSLTHYCDSIDWDRASADAVAFVPSSAAGGTNLKIVIAHYFVQNATGTYLVNLDSTIKYYRVEDDGDEKVENGELVEMTSDEAAAAGIVSGRSYGEERQNFANWFQFARSRNHVSKYAIGTLVSSMGNIYFGFTTIPSRDVYSLRAVREAMVLNRDDTLEVLNNIYNLANPNGGTPLKDGFQKVGDFFTGGASLVNNADKQYFFNGGFSDVDSFPYLNQDHGGNCQQAFMIAMTDGWYNSNQGQNVGNYDNDDSSDWDGGEYGDTYTNTLADISMGFYERDMKADTILTDDVPTNDWDKNNEQHVVTYALAFGVPGTIDPESWPDCPSATGAGQVCPDWPKPVDSTATTIDDLYHTTVNGRGMFLNAGNPQELVDALMKIKQNIEERLGSSAAVTTSSVQRQIGSKLYRGQYMTGKWTGDLQAFEIDSKTGAVYPDYAWSAKEELEKVTDYTQRKIYSFNGSNGIPFDFNSMTTDQKTRLSDGLAYAFGTLVSTPDTEEFVNYMRGDASNDRAHGGPFRTRVSLLGDIVHSEAEYNDRVLYVAANDGMLHAFHGETGMELGAYVPNMLYGELPKLAYPQYQHQYFVNNTPFVADTGARKLLVCPMSKGYKGLFVLDVTAPMGEAEASKVGLWEYPGTGATDPDLGYTYSYATIFKTQAAGWVVITGNGYDSTNGHAILYVFDAFTGSVVAKLDTGVGGCNGLSSPAVIDPDANGVIDYVYAGDLKGNMWKFDLTGTSVSDWKIAYKDGTTPMPLITVTGPTGNPQPITNMPGVMFVNKCNPPGSKGFLILFGTGKYLGITDTNDGSQQSVYGVYDWGPDWVIKNGPGAGANKYLGTFGTARTLPNATSVAGQEVNLVQQTISIVTKTINGETYRFISNNPVVYYNVAASAGDALGWYADLPDYKERMVRRPVIRNNVFLFVSNIPEKSVCSAGGTSVLYQVDACSGGWPENPQFDTDGDGDFDEDDLISSGTSLTDAELLAMAKDMDGDGDVDWNDVLIMFDTNNNNTIDSDERLASVPPIGKEFDSIILDPTLLQDVLYLNDIDDVQGQTIPELPIGAWFWHVVE